MGINSQKLFAVLNKPNIKTALASTESDIITELKKVLDDTNRLIPSRTIEEAVKYILWQGILNNFGTLGNKRDTIRSFNNKEYYNESFSRGTLLSIDFGLSNIGKEFAYTHTGIVMADYTGFVVVIPLTTIRETTLNNVPQDIKDDIIQVFQKNYHFLAEDSYVLSHHIRSVSKNRITKVITTGTFNKMPIMEEIENILFKRNTPYLRKLNMDRVESLQNEVESLQNQIEQLKQVIEAQK